MAYSTQQIDKAQELAKLLQQCESITGNKNGAIELAEILLTGNIKKETKEVPKDSLTFTCSLHNQLDLENLKFDIMKIFSETLLNNYDKRNKGDK